MSFIDNKILKIYTKYRGVVMKKLISIVVPCFNEQEVLPYFYEEIKKIAQKMIKITLNLYLLMMDQMIIPSMS